MDYCGCMRLSSVCEWSGLCRELEVYHGRPAHQFPPPSSGTPIDRLWIQLPAYNRQRLIWLLSQALERQLRVPSNSRRKEASHDRASTKPA